MNSQQNKLPKGWQEVELGDEDIFEIQSGGTPSKSKKEYWENGTVPWIGSTACKDLPVYEAEQFITESGLKNSSAKLFQKNTVLIALVGATIGKTGLLMFDCSTNQNIAGIIIKSKNKVDCTYLFLAVRQLYSKFISLSSDTFKMANLSFVRSLKIHLPPISTQKKIVSLLAKAEKLKQKREQADNLTKDYLQGVFYEMFGDPINNEKKWEVKKIDDVSEVKGRVGWKGYKKEDLRNFGPLVLGATHITEDGTIDISDPVYLSEEKYEESPDNRTFHS